MHVQWGVEILREASSDHSGIAISVRCYLLSVDRSKVEN